MCMSPDEQTSAALEEQLAWMDEAAAAGGEYWAWRANGIRNLLKERAENGTYATAGH